MYRPLIPIYAKAAVHFAPPEAFRDFSEEGIIAALEAHLSKVADFMIRVYHEETKETVLARRSACFSDRDSLDAVVTSRLSEVQPWRPTRKNVGCECFGGRDTIFDGALPEENPDDLFG